jgi:diguanylate cyclase (GGDEF)-like protein
VELVAHRRAAVELPRATGLLAAAVAEHPVGVVVVLDVDGMSRVNARLGRAAGDVLLTRVFAAVRGAVGGRGQVMPFAGDQVLAVLPGDQDPERLLRELGRAVRRAGVRRARVTASAGVASWPGSGRTPAGLLVAAAASLDRAKRRS